MIQRGDTLKKQAYMLIRDKIMKHEVGFGDRLNIAELAREFGISNSPIREALSLLQQDGFVENTPGGGFRVLALNKDAFEMLEQLIHILLIGCYSECILTGREDALADLLDERLRAQRSAYGDENILDYIDVAIDFDLAFVDACENPLFKDLYATQFELLKLYVINEYATEEGNQEKNLKEHEAIAAAVRKKDAKEVTDLILKHYNKELQIFEEN